MTPHPPSPGCARGNLSREDTPRRFSLLLWAVVLVLSAGTSTRALAVCAADVSVTTQARVAEEAALRQTEQVVRASRARVQVGEAALRSRLAHPPPDFAPALTQQLATLRRTEVAPKLSILEHLRAQHEEARRQWERGHHLLSSQLAQAHLAFQAKTITPDVYCHIRATYQHAVRFYWQGIQRYRQGLALYAQALDRYEEQFLTPYLQGFTDQQLWPLLLAHLRQRDFLHEVLVPLTANAVRSLPPDMPPD